ncbi:L-threonylcarbamoyladenylate synthase [Paeniglutamicibacter sp. Y32M11]|uniref:L-threonylcarbamoyladenylate synthase n=1 Tax=Paeniglutamicibacter sp. Y32M11 TaxID=2853258 RepID=UPI002106D23B|nr:L-threonylcarbamoyladenylate synthase [Paeniglutamicibacter sp. Y32M11]
MTSRFDAHDSIDLEAGLEAARTALAANRCIVMPTDTVYGIAADAFSAQAVATLLAAKGRGRSMPPPVLMPAMATMDGLATDVPLVARNLAEKFWPGALTLILPAQPSLTWDLGETRGTVALRVPDDEVARALLRTTGPLAVSSANRTGHPAAATAAEAFDQLGESVEVYLEAGPRPISGEALSSTIIDCTLTPPRVVRAGALSLEQLRTVAPELLDIDGHSAIDENADAVVPMEAVETSEATDVADAAVLGEDVQRTESVETAVAKPAFEIDADAETTPGTSAAQQEDTNGVTAGESPRES